MEYIYNNGTVEMPRDAYDSLCELKRENANLRNEIARLAKKKEQRVIEVTNHSCGASATGLQLVSYNFKNFDDVKEQAEKHYGNTIEMLDAKVKDLRKDEQELRKEINELKDKNLDLNMQISKLKRRNLWQRIWNK